MQNRRNRNSRNSRNSRQKNVNPTNGVGSVQDSQQTTLPETVALPTTLTVKQLADILRVDPIDVIKELIRNGVMANINQAIDFDNASSVASELGFTVTSLDEADQDIPEYTEVDIETDPDRLVSRPPVITILGHVDHGKTTLLDAIRQSNVTDAEVGGITQRIGAYQVEYKGQKLTFLDTPGHEAFTSMRSRGAKVTDIAVLVVAADDGVMPQTIEAINHAKSAEVPIVVAINKVDVPDSDIDRVKSQLVEHGLVIEEWGGEVIVVPISARDHLGIEDLLENILVVAEISDLKADPERPAVGVIIEANIDKSKGPVATVLIQTGTLEVGQIVVSGDSWGRVKALIDDSGMRITKADPSTPAEILGLTQVPQVGETLRQVHNQKIAKDLIRDRQRLPNANQPIALTTLEDASSSIGTGQITELNLIVKTDIQGSLDAIRGTLDKLSSDLGRVNIVHMSTGTINEGDVLLASASNSTIIGFNTKIEPGAKRMAQVDKTDVRFYEIIYRLSEDIQKALEGLLTPVAKEVIDGHLEVRAIFNLGRRIKIAGSYVTDGRVSRTSSVRVTRDVEILHSGPVDSLKHFKDDVREVTVGFECGITIDGFSDLQIGDSLEAFHIE